MKLILLPALTATAIIYIACGNGDSSTSKTETAKTDSVTKPSANNNEPKVSGSINSIVSGYLNLKNALASDNGTEAAEAAHEISSALVKTDESALTAEQKKVYDDVKDDIKEHAEHIGKNGSDIKHQREHFDLLSEDIIDLVKSTGSTRTLYNDFCPMYNDKKGASWLSESKDIKNPYYGKEMSACGEVKEEIKPRG